MNASLNFITLNKHLKANWSGVLFVDTTIIIMRYSSEEESVQMHCRQIKSNIQIINW